MSRPSEITAFPGGLLGILGNKATGQNPNVMLGEARLTVDSMQLYLENQAVNNYYFEFAPGTVGVKRVTNLTVPPGEMWWVRGFSVLIDASGEGGGTVRPLVFGVGSPTSVTNIIDVGSFISASSSTNLQDVTAFNYPNGFFLLPSAGLGYFVRTVTAELGVNLNVQYARIPL